jgi:hypothetical protein
MKLTFGFGLLILCWGIALLGSTAPVRELRDLYLGWNVWIDDSLNIYTNISEHQIAKYSSQGEKLLVIGRKGEGPGDIKRLGGMAVNPKDHLLYVTEYFRGNKRISVFSPKDGHFVKTWPCQLDFNKWPGVSQIQFDNLGNAYVQVGQFTWRKHANFEVGVYERVIFKFDPTGKQIKELYRLESDSSAYRDKKGHPNIPYQNYPAWTIYQDNFYVRESRAKHISVFTLDGTPVKKITLPFERVPVRQQDKDAWEKWQRSLPMVRQGIAQGWFDIKFWKKNLPFPEYKSISTGPMFIGPHNTLYSRKVSKTFDGDENIYAVISLDTGKTNIRRFPPNHTLKAVKNGHFYFHVRNQDDEDTLKIIPHQELQKQ